MYFTIYVVLSMVFYAAAIYGLNKDESGLNKIRKLPSILLLGLLTIFVGPSMPIFKKIRKGKRITSIEGIEVLTHSETSKLGYVYMSSLLNMSSLLGQDSVFSVVIIGNRDEKYIVVGNNFFNYPSIITNCFLNHEVGHAKNDHLGMRKSISSLEKELEADQNMVRNSSYVGRLLVATLFCSLLVSVISTGNKEASKEVAKRIFKML